MKSLRLTLAIACLVMIFIGSDISHAELRDGLISAWLFDDGTAKDSVGKNNGKIEKAKVVEGKFGKALSFDGKTAYVNLGDTKNFPNGSSKRTVAFWTLLRNKAATDNYFMSFGECVKGAPNGGTFFAPRVWQGNIGFMVNSDGDFNDVDSDTPIGEIFDVWSHLAYTYDGAITVEIHLNGSLIFKGSTGLKLDTSTGFDALIGGRNCFGGFANGMDASIDEVGIWNRVLSDDEIASLAKISLGVAMSVEPSGKLSTLWGIIKGQTQ